MLPFLACPGLVAADLGVPEFEAVYRVKVSIARGQMRLDFDRRDGALVYHSELEPMGLVSIFKRGMIEETSRFEYGGGKVRPLEYDLVDTISEGHDAHYDFDWAANEVSGSYRGNPVDAPLDGHVVDRLLLQLAIMSDLAHGRDVDTYTIFDRAEAKQYSIEIGENGTAETPAGDFSVIEVTYTDEDGDSIVLECAPDLHYLPVRIRQRKDGEIQSRAELVEYRMAETTE